MRVAVECAIGRLQARFRCLLKRLDVDYHFATEIVGACCTLHNIFERSNEEFPERWLNPNEHVLFPQSEDDVYHDDENAHHVPDALYARFYQTSELSQ